MPSRAETAALRDILNHIELAQQFTRGQNIAALQSDLLRLYAVTRCLEIISEASRRLSDDLKARHPDIPWREMAAAGNVYRHDYEDVVAKRVWDTVELALPPLKLVVEQELAAAS